VLTPTLSDSYKFDQLRVEVDYDFYNADSTVTEDAAKTEYKWYKTLKDNYREYSVAVGSGKDYFQQIDDFLPDRCEVTVWDSNGSRGKTVTAQTAASTAAVNVLLGASVVSQIAGNTTASRLVDGNRSSSSKWDYTTVGGVAGPWSAVLDMGFVKSFNKFAVYHSNAYPSQSYDENPLIATYDFDLSYSLDNVTWTTKEIRANTLAVTTVDLGAIVEARYVRITVITPNNGGTTFDTSYKSIRIAELEAIYYDPGIQLDSRKRDSDFRGYYV
jgi:hypothetical protein